MMRHKEVNSASSTIIDSRLGDNTHKFVGTARKTNSTQLENEKRLADRCPFAHTLGILGRRWRPALIWKINQGHVHYGHLRRELPGISEKMLGQELAWLQREGLIARQISAPRQSRYKLTEHGESLLPVLRGLWEWGERALQPRP